MAEVRQIPSAVGAFEAQIIDFNKTYNAIVQNAAAVRKRQAQAQKDIEKQIDVALADKRAIRPQDSDYIEEKRKDVYNYFYQNKDNIESGGKARAELKMKMGEFTSAVNQSASLNRRGMNLNPAWKEAMKDENDMDEGLVEAQRVWSLPINSDERKKATFSRGGVQTSIDEFDVPDIGYYKKFDEVKDLDAPIKSNVVPFEKEIVTPGVKNKFGLTTDDIKKVKVYDADAIINQTVSVAMGPKSRGFLSSFNKQLQLYKTQSQEDRDLEFKSVADAYKQVAGKDITGYFKKEGGEGIDNELELAAFRKLQSRLPQVVREAYDYRTQNALLAQWRQGLAASKFDYQKKQNITLDEQIANDIESGKFSGDKWNKILDPLYNIGNAATGAVRAGDVKFSEPDTKGNITITSVTNTPVLSTDGNLITDINSIEAQRYNNPTAGIKVKVSPIGVVYAEQTRTDVVNKKDPARLTKIIAINDRVRNAVSVEDAGKSIDNLRKKTELIGQPSTGAKQPTIKGSGQSVKLNKTTNR